MKVAVVDYGLSNLKSIKNVLDYLDITYEFVTEYKEAQEYTQIILPGVGSFKNGMFGLKKSRLDEFIKDAAEKKIPILGICLGMQLLLTKSYEFGETNGLDLIPGEVLGFNVDSNNGFYLNKVPHIGWNSLTKTNLEWTGTILDGLSGHSMYFVHSFYCKVTSNEHQLAATRYLGVDFASVIKRDNIFGCQFHPEKSGKHGIQIIENFLDRN